VVDGISGIRRASYRINIMRGDFIFLRILTEQLTQMKLA
jgi:hypothetical protein